MLHRDTLETGDLLLYLPGQCEVEVVSLDSFWVLVKDPDGSLHEVGPEDLQLYERTTLRA